MTTSDDKLFISLVDKQRFGRELAELLDNESFQSLLNGMVDKRKELLRVIDACEGAETNDVFVARMKRNVIQWFLDSIVYSVSEGERATKEIKRITDYEQKRNAKEVK